MGYDEIYEAISEAPVTWLPALLVQCVDTSLKRKVFADAESLQRVVKNVCERHTELAERDKSK